MGNSSHHMASQADANYPASLSTQDPFMLGGSLGDREGLRGAQAWPDTQASQGPEPLMGTDPSPQVGRSRPSSINHTDCALSGLDCLPACCLCCDACQYTCLDLFLTTITPNTG